MLISDYIFFESLLKGRLQASNLKILTLDIKEKDLIVKNRICFETAQTTKFGLIKTGFTFIKKGFS